MLQKERQRMKLRLCNVNVMEKLSEETTCFHATLFDGNTLLCEVSNHGHGGSHNWSDWDAQKKVAAYAKTLPKRPWGFDVPDDMEKEYQPDADAVIDDLLSEVLNQQHLKKIMKKSIIVYNTVQEQIIGYDTTPKTPVTPERLRNFRAEHPDSENSIILNDMDFSEAYALYMRMVT